MNQHPAARGLRAKLLEVMMPRQEYTARELAQRIGHTHRGVASELTKMRRDNLVSAREMYKPERGGPRPYLLHHLREDRT